MSKIMLSLNFMHCMERFATQVYRTQMGAFKNNQVTRKLVADASANELEHVQKLKTRIKQLNGSVYPLGWLFQIVGFILGAGTRLAGSRNLFKTDVFVEARAVKDYGSFLTTVPFDTDTVDLIRKIISEEEQHIANWRQAVDAVKKKRLT